jgi:hypothetical protein
MGKLFAYPERAEGDYQIAERTESRTPPLAPSENRSRKNADGRVATEVAWLNGTDSEREARKTKERKTNLTRTGLLKEGLCCRSFLYSLGITTRIRWWICVDI